MRHYAIVEVNIPDDALYGASNLDTGIKVALINDGYRRVRVAVIDDAIETGAISRSQVRALLLGTR
jgi:hypothetical protein